MSSAARETDQLEGAETRRGPNTRMWLNAGAVTLGVGAAMVAGAAVASADTGAGSGPSSGHSASSASRAHASSSTASTPAKSTSALRAAAKPAGSTRVAASAKSSASFYAITVPSTPAPASASRRTPSASALAAASTTSAANAQPVALATPTPNNILQGLQEFGHNVYLTVADQITGVQNNLAVLGEDMLTVLGISRETITGPGNYGNPALNKGYVPMANYVQAPLATVAMAYGQLTGTAPDLPGFTKAALSTDSLVYPGFKILRSVDTTSFVKWTDSYELLQDKNVRVITNQYVNESKAINALSAGLSDPTKVMIAAISGPVDGQTYPGSKTVVVLGLDTTRGIVTINDPTQAATGQGLEMKLADFTKQWSAQNYQLVTTQLAASSTTPLPEPATKLVWSLPAINEIGQALEDGLTNVAQLVVHQIEGVQTNLGVLANDLSYTFGITDPNIAPPAPLSIEYGNYTKNYPYYVYQGGYASCVLMATAAIIGQLQGGPMPADLGQKVLDQAQTTPSGYYVNQKMYYPEGVDGVKGQHWGTQYVDALKLLSMNGVTADMTKYTSSQGDLALDTMNNALSENQAVMVAVSSNVIQNAYTRKYFGSAWRNPEASPVSDHAVVVISVDTTKNVVYINDSAWKNGQGLPIPLEEFMRAWRASNYLLITAQKAT